MAKIADRDLSRIGLLDYVLMSIGSCFAVYSAGMCINIPSISIFCMILVVLGSAVSYGMRQLTLHSPMIKLDAFFYSGGVIASIFLATELRALMPEGGFPREMGAASWLSWMLILGSFATWQDSTLLFQAIPALALFGLIGCYDTFRGVTLAFFAFLICLATLFARAHGREMLRKASESGYFTRGLAPGTPIPSVETTPGLALELKKGPWRWIAGPEWALASAIAVVLISLLGAPVIRDSVATVGGGFVKINQPPVRSRVSPIAPNSPDVSGSVVRIGRPFQHTVARKLFEVSSKQGAHLYLRSDVYDIYTGHGWQNAFGGTQPIAPPTGSQIARISRPKIKDAEQYPFSLHLLRFMKLLPVPPDTQSVVTTGNRAELLIDGTWALVDQGTQSEFDIQGIALIPKGQASPVNCTRAEWGNYVSAENATPTVRRLADKVTAGKKTDYDKAIAIQEEISRRVLYNLDADETPPNRDPVEFTLFELKEGYCTAFASAMTLMARSVGLPARYVQGYLTDERRREPDGKYVVTDADYHAWSEIYFDDFGWVIFDPTIGALAKDGEGLGDIGDNRPWYQRGIVSFVLDVAIIATAVGLIVSGINFIRSRQRFANIRTEVERTYVVFSKALERSAGHRRSVGQTADEFLESVRPHLDGMYESAHKLNERFVTAMYAPSPMDPESLNQLRGEVKAFCSGIGKVPKKGRR